MEKIRSKFHCKAVSDNSGKKVVVLYPVLSGSVEGDSVVDESPEWKIKLSIANAGIAKKFQEGKEYYLDFTPVD